MSVRSKAIESKATTNPKNFLICFRRVLKGVFTRFHLHLCPVGPLLSRDQLDPELLKEEEQKAAALPDQILFLQKGNNRHSRCRRYIRQSPNHRIFRLDQ